MAGISARVAGVAAGTCGLIGLAFASATPLTAKAGQRSAVGSTSLCMAGETKLFACGIGGKQVAVCGQGGQAVYRYGRAGQVELATADLTLAMRGFAGGGETQITARNRDYSYIVFDRTVRTSFGNDGRHDAGAASGLLVRQGGRIVSAKSCTTDTAISAQAEKMVKPGAFVAH